MPKLFGGQPYHKLLGWNSLYYSEGAERAAMMCMLDLTGKLFVHGAKLGLDGAWVLHELLAYEWNKTVRYRTCTSLKWGCRRRSRRMAA